MRKGFTLIEMLIVVAIIGLLAGAVLVGLGPVQKGGRDARRVSDLRQLQNGLELYYSRNSMYPTTNNWETDLTTVVRSLPKDPRGSSYHYQTDTNRTWYVLGTLMEDPSSSAASSSYTGTMPAGSNFSIGACGSSPATGGFVYCLSL
ncbi:MAG: Type II secretion system protein G [Parcubacteria group bacterium GW2011_GWA1_59_11]|nr:MAG: Type II secretion system protein G [Parcubacteria group bacterium GW2011_GWA1_59_11]